MATDKQHILERARTAGYARPSAGLEVPDGYFADFAARMAASLPERPELEHPDDIAAETSPRTFWQHIRPYVYMAAMFAGVWLMMQLFGIITGSNSLQPMDSNPVLAEALTNDSFVYDYIYDDVESWEIFDDMETGQLDDDTDFADFFAE